MQQTDQREDLYQRVTNQIIAAIERGAGDYQMPWNPKLCASAATGLPHNPIGHYAYRGINILSLWASQHESAYATTAWATFKQWQAAGAQVRRGEKGTLTVFFKPIDASDRPAAGEDEQSSRRFVAKAAYVFNAAQVDGYEPASPPALPTIERHAGADVLIQASGASIHHGSHQACYVPSRDQIHLPPEGAFRDAESYYGVALHELIHWTGHEHRCARDLRHRFGSEAYAAEELIAEMGAAFLCAELGITPEPRIDHARYIESWLRVLKSDKRAIFTAASKASQAANYLRSRLTAEMQCRS